MLEEHKTKARLSHEDYIKLTGRCKEVMEQIQTLEQDSEANEDELVRRKQKLILSADYQMNKLVPYWGLSPQPGFTYYLQKLSHDILGIVNHSDNTSAIYIFDEHTGPKNIDHTVSYITDYLSQSGKVPTWIRRLHRYMDNAWTMHAQPTKTFIHLVGQTKWYNRENSTALFLLPDTLNLHQT